LPIEVIGGEVWGRPAARGGDVATSCGGGATQLYSLSARQADGAPVAVEEDAAAMAKLLLVSLVAKSCKVVIGLLVGEEEKQTQEFTMYTS
jgi:hypothetical protein